MDRNETMKKIKEALKDRSGKSWSVKGGTGTAYGWITIDVMPKARTWDAEGVTPKDEWGYSSKADREELGKLLGLETVHCQGVSIPSSNAYYQEFLDRSEGRAPSVMGTPYWD